MAISREFAQVVSDKKLLRCRIMLKDSLLVDKSFQLFDEMVSYSIKNGLDPWDENDTSLEKASKPWDENIMNYELTAVVNDFTKEHIKYVKQIITSIYGKPTKTSSPKPTTGNPKPATSGGGSSSRNSNYNPKKNIVTEFFNIYNIFVKNKNDKNGGGKWYIEDVKRIKMSAQKIVDDCDRMLGG